MQFGFMPERGTIDAVHILRRQQEKYHAKGKKLYMHFVELEKALNRIPRKMLEWAMKEKKRILQFFARSEMSQEGAKTRVKVDSDLSEEFKVKVGVHQAPVLSS